MSRSSNRLGVALSLYLLLGAGAGLFVDGKMRLGLWIFLGGLAVKTLIAHYKPEDN